MARTASRTGFSFKGSIGVAQRRMTLHVAWPAGSDGGFTDIIPASSGIGLVLPGSLAGEPCSGEKADRGSIFCNAAMTHSVILSGSSRQQNEVLIRGRQTREPTPVWGPFIASGGWAVWSFASGSQADNARSGPFDPDAPEVVSRS
jgi:hypothetical protein